MNARTKFEVRIPDIIRGTQKMWTAPEYAHAVSATSPQQVGNKWWEWNLGNDMTQQTQPRQLVTDLLRGNWCNGFWPL